MKAKAGSKKVNKIDKPQARLIRKMEKRHKLPTTGMRNITTNSK